MGSSDSDSDREKKSKKDKKKSRRNSDSSDDVRPAKKDTGSKKRDKSPSPAGSDDEFEVEKICDKRLKKGIIEYYIKWKGFPESDNTWEPVGNLSCKDKIEAFESDRKKEKDKKLKAEKEKEEKRKKEKEEAKKREEDKKREEEKKEKERAEKKEKERQERKDKERKEREEEEKRKVEKEKEKKRARRISGSDSDEPKEKKRNEEKKDDKRDKKDDKKDDKRDDKKDKKVKTVEEDEDDAAVVTSNTSFTHKQTVSSFLTPEPSKDKSKSSERVDGNDAGKGDSIATNGVDKKTGFERGLEPKKIVGAVKVNEKIMFLMRWTNSEEELLFSDIARNKCPHVVIKYYENRLKWDSSKNCDKK